MFLQKEPGLLGHDYWRFLSRAQARVLVEDAAMSMEIYFVFASCRRRKGQPHLSDVEGTGSE